MTFEQQFKEVIKNDFETILGDKFKVFITNDLSFRNYKKNDILAIIKTGQGTTSGVENILATNIVTTITLMCESNYLQEVLSKLTDYVNQVNGKYFEFEENNILVKLGLNTPYVIGSPTITNIGNESIYTSVCQIIGNIFYSDLSKPKNKYLTFGSEKIKIEGIQTFQDTSNYNYTYSETESMYGEQLFNSVSRVIVFQIYVKNNPICNKLDKEKLYNKIYIMQIGDDEDENKEQLQVIFTSKNKIETNGVEVFNVTLSIVGEVT